MTALLNIHWPIEPTVLYIFLYYPTNATNTPPDYTSNLLQDYNTCVQAAKDYIVTQGNIGVVIIQPITCEIVYPYVSKETD